ncbi:primosomal protein N' [Candidatus Saccharibacteria bacterium]|nr:primosomal protein N' [Candidatus Saccharibacteria bacterium]
MFYEVIPTKVFRASSGILTYTFPENLIPGTLVEVPLGQNSARGVVYRKVTEPDFKCKPISKVLHEKPLPSHLLKSLLWLSRYYLTPLPVVANLILPVPPSKQYLKENYLRTDGACSKNGENRSDEACNDRPEEASPKCAGNFPLNTAQKTALEAIKTTVTATKLLHGITGSGKTNIYLKMAQETLNDQKSTILLVPEIALTSQLVQVFQSSFGDRVICLHSRQTDATRRDLWYKIHDATTPLIIIGPRSALFSPLHNLGLIIIDEAHESAYFQETAPKYSALRLASFIASTLKITCLQGTATPLVSDYYLAEKNHAYISLTERAKTSAIQPDIFLIDLKKRENFIRNHYFSDDLLKAIRVNLEHHYQTLIFHNRRGSAPLTICSNCGWQALCPTCFLPLNLHSDSYTLICHTCGYQTKVPTNCPDCHHPDIVHKGFGTKLLESELNKLFKEARIVRFDADNKKSDTLDALYEQVKNGDFNIIIGTQTVAKGLDLPLLATVGVVQADSGLSLPDFASEERTFHLLTQVIGRVGRGHLDTAQVFMQTFQPEHPVVQAAIHNDYTAFSKYLLSRRRAGHLPPFAYLARLDLTYKTEVAALAQIRRLQNSLKKFPKLLVSNPAPAFHERSTKGYSWQLILRATSRKTLEDAIQNLPPNPHLHFTIDPPSLL